MNLFLYLRNRTLAVLLITVLFLPHYSQGQFKSIILGRPTDKSVTASVYFDQNVEFFIEYGTQTGVYSTKTTFIQNKAKTPNHVDITGLAANSKYFYRLQWRAVNTTTYSITPEYSFQTQRAAGTTFKFIVEGDEHLHDKKGSGNLYKICLQNQLKENPDFMICMGDMFGDDHTPNSTTSADMDFYHRDLLQYLGTACHSMPFFFCLGNHEGEFGYYLKQNPPNNIAVYATNWRKNYFANPFPNSFYTGNSTKEAFGMDLPENYYSFTWGDALFVVIDVYRHCDANEKPQNWDWSLGKEQYDWFKKTLETSKAKYKFVMGHHTRGQGRGAKTTANAFEWGGNGNKNTYEFDTQRPGWGLPIHQLMVKNGVNIFFQGHDHLYAKESLDGLVYQVSPMACDSTYTIGVLANADAYTEVTSEGSGHLTVTVSPENIKVDFVRAYLPADTKDGKHKNGEIAYSYTIGSNGNQNPNPVILGTSNAINKEPEIKVYPNPTLDQLKIEWLNTVTPTELKVNVSDSKGIFLFQTESSMIDLSQYPAGQYFLTIETGTKQITKKVTISH
ncbi:MAG: metallophosphoesterase [Spirosomataceae bacterium]